MEEKHLSAIHGATSSIRDLGLLGNWGSGGRKRKKSGEGGKSGEKKPSCLTQFSFKNQEKKTIYQERQFPPPSFPPSLHGLIFLIFGHVLVNLEKKRKVCFYVQLLQGFSSLFPGMEEERLHQSPPSHASVLAFLLLPSTSRASP